MSVVEHDESVGLCAKPNRAARALCDLEHPNIFSLLKHRHTRERFPENLRLELDMDSV